MGDDTVTHIQETRVTITPDLMHTLTHFCYS